MFSPSSSVSFCEAISYNFYNEHTRVVFALSHSWIPDSMIDRYAFCIFMVFAFASSAMISLLCYKIVLKI